MMTYTADNLVETRRIGKDSNPIKATCGVNSANFLITGDGIK
jgi:hypothetical protein